MAYQLQAHLTCRPGMERQDIYRDDNGHFVLWHPTQHYGWMFHIDEWMIPILLGVKESAD